MANYILKKYEIKQRILKLQNEVHELIKVNKILSNIDIYNELKKVDLAEANRFRRLHLDTRKEGIFNLRVKNGLKIELPNLPTIEYKKKKGKC